MEYLTFLLIGLVNAVFAEFAMVPEQMLAGDLLPSVFLHLVFLSIAFAISGLLLKKSKDKFTEYLFFYFVFGFLGLIVVEWILVGNLKVLDNFWLNLLTQIFMFSFWAGVVSIPKILLDRRLDKKYRKRFEQQILIMFTIFIIIGLVFLYLSGFEAWKVPIALFYILLNILFIKHFIYLKITN